MIRVDRVHKRFAGTAILDGLALEVGGGEIVSLIGPSGCGKSTVLRLIAGLETSDGGRITVGDRTVSAPDPSVGFMFQEPRLLPWLSVRDNIALGLPRAARRDARIDDLLAQVQLPGVAALRPHQLSGGMAQRVALARCLAVDARAILLDEPFSAVDALTRMALQDLLVAIWARTRPALLLVTHDLDEALYLSDRVLVLRGRPAAITEAIAIDLPRPRDRRALAHLRTQLFDALHLDPARPRPRPAIHRSAS